MKHFVICIFIFLGYTNVNSQNYKSYKKYKNTKILNKQEKLLLHLLSKHKIEEKEIVFSQAILETGHFTSRLCCQNNNLFGIYDSKNKRYFSFKNWDESIKAYKNSIQYRKRKNENYYNFLRRIKYSDNKKYISVVKIIRKQYFKK